METSGEILIQGLWKIYTDAIISVRFGDLDTDTYRKEPMEISWIDGRRKIRKKTVIPATSKIKFSPFLLSVDGIFGREAIVVLKNLSQLMAEELE